MALFGKYLAYVVAKTMKAHIGTQLRITSTTPAKRRPVLVDAWAVGVSVAVEAVASLISVEGDKEKAERVAFLQDRMRKWFAEQSDLQDLADRVNGQIDAMSNRRARGYSIRACRQRDMWRRITSKRGLTFVTGTSTQQ